MPTIDDLFNRQKVFNDLFYNSDTMSEKQKEEITKSLSLALHAEVSSLVSGLNYRDHTNEIVPVNKTKILYESVDVFRYVLAILNLWKISSDQFVSAFHDKDLFLHTRHQSSQSQWSGQNVIIFDLDDVIIEFRTGFIEWLERTHNLKIDRNSSEYYTTAEVMAAGLNPEQVFFDFIRERELRSLAPNSDMISVIDQLRDAGYWIHILTARPRENLLCCYDTFHWINESGLQYDRISFSSEKYRWLTQSDYFDSGKVVCAVDDSAKHAAEYAKHGIHVYVPRASYNTELEGRENISMYDSSKDFLRCFLDKHSL